MASLPYPLNCLYNHGRVGMAGMPYPPTDCRSYIKINVNIYLLNSCFAFRNRRIYPIKAQGEADMERLLKHFTCEEITVECEDGTKYPKRIFEFARSQRLHWINHHIKEKTPLNIDVFTVEEKDSKKRKVKKTYIYDTVEKYVIVLEQQRTNAFYLLTAYHLNKEYGEKALLKKMKKRIPTPI